MTRFNFLTGDVNWLQYGAKWISPRLNNGEFDYWLVLELVNMHDATGEEDQDKYNVDLCAVSPDQAGADNVNKAIECVGMPDECRDNPIALVEALHSYGVKSLLWSGNGNNAHKLLKEAKHQPVDMLFGFYMDTPKNRIGTTGWEAIKGDLNSALSRTIASGSVEGNILAKMNGITPPTKS